MRRSLKIALILAVICMSVARAESEDNSLASQIALIRVEETRISMEIKLLENANSTFKSECVPARSPEAMPRCQAEEARLKKWQQELIARAQSLARAKAALLRRSEHPDQTAQNKREQTYRPSERAFIGGTGWRVGYNLQNATPAMVAEVKEMLRQQMKLAGQPYDDSINFDTYNFVLGVASSTNFIVDLGQRVFFDNFTNGKHSAEMQNLYASLRGRSFDELSCHSNGAMVCLAALSNKDILAGNVVLYGPQITPESLQKWNELVQSGQVKSVTIHVNDHDLVPAVSMYCGSRTITEIVKSLAWFLRITVTKKINEIAPNIVVQEHACKHLASTFKCHFAGAYRED